MANFKTHMIQRVRCAQTVTVLARWLANDLDRRAKIVGSHHKAHWNDYAIVIKDVPEAVIIRWLDASIGFSQRNRWTFGIYRLSVTSSPFLVPGVWDRTHRFIYLKQAHHADAVDLMPLNVPSGIMHLFQSDR